MKCFTVRENSVVEGIEVKEYTGKDFSYFYLPCGEEGRGRFEGRIVIRPDVNLNVLNEERTKFNLLEGEVEKKLDKFRICKNSNITNGYIVALLFDIGFRGSNSYKFSDNVVILAEGTIAQGEAGGMGSGNQYIVVMPEESWVTVEISGRLYGNPNEYVVINEKGLICLDRQTYEEKELVEIP